MAKTNNRLYLIPVLSKALDILELLQTESGPLTLDVIHRRTGISKTTIYRVLKTFSHRGYVVQTPDGGYRQISNPKKLRFGFAGQSAEMAFSEEVTRSLTAAAAAAGIDLLVLDNSYDAATAVNNAAEMVKQQVDLAIELQVDHEVAAVIGDKFAAANIPLIAIDIPHPNGTFFGVDNYRVGLAAGEVLAEHALSQWGGKVGWVLGLDLPEAGTLVQSRTTGAFDAVKAALPQIPVECYVRMNGRGMRDRSRQLVADFLKRHPKDKRILIAAATDTSALGVVDAVRDVWKTRQIAIVGQDGVTEALDEMKQKSSPLIGSVSHETAMYGPSLIQLSMALLQGRTVAPYNYVTHKMVRRDRLLAETVLN